MNKDYIRVFQLNLSDQERKDIIDLIYSIKETETGRVVSNRGGWQHIAEFNPILKSFAEQVFQFCKHYVDLLGHKEAGHPVPDMIPNEFWYNVNPPNTYNTAHCHAYNGISGIVYLQIESGDIEIIDTSGTPVALKISDRFTYKPNVNDIVIFPSNYLHEVRLNESTEDRISIAFNMDLELKKNEQE
jgi:uncharacterized protein (TIGR02466 family)